MTKIIIDSDLGEAELKLWKCSTVLSVDKNYSTYPTSISGFEGWTYPIGYNEGKWEIRIRWFTNQKTLNIYKYWEFIICVKIWGGEI